MTEQTRQLAAMLTEQQKQFIEAAALALTERCETCGRTFEGVSTATGHAYHGDGHHPFRAPDLVACRYVAAYLLGKMEQANGCTLETIIEAAMKAECRTAKCAMSHGDFIRDFASAIALEAIGAGKSWFDDHEQFKLPEGCGHQPKGGPRWVDGPYFCRTHGGQADFHGVYPCTGLLVVPSIEFTYRPEGA
jgi:hypothetical protein